MEEPNDIPFWIELALSAGVITFILGFIYLPGYIVRLRRGEPDQTQGVEQPVGTVKPRLSILMLGILTVLLSGFIEILSLLAIVKDNPWWTHVGFSLWCGVGIYLITGYLRSSFTYDERGASSTTTFGNKGSVLWIELRKVGFSTIMERLTFETRIGNKIRVSTGAEFYSGTRELATMVLDRVDANVIEDGAREALEGLAVGKSPHPHLRDQKQALWIRFLCYLANKLRKVVANRRRR